MTRYNLGELEELMLLLVSGMGDEAYGANIRQQCARKAKRNLTLSTVHVTLHRLEEKGFVKSIMGEASPVRGGKRKRIFKITAYGLRVLAETRELREKLWTGIPQIALQKR
jgi:PadR family transcriptional regulator, regulatory protein PadR